MPPLRVREGDCQAPCARPAPGATRAGRGGVHTRDAGLQCASTTACHRRGVDRAARDPLQTYLKDGRHRPKVGQLGHVTVPPQEPHQFDVHVGQQLAFRNALSLDVAVGGNGVSWGAMITSASDWRAPTAAGSGPGLQEGGKVDCRVKPLLDLHRRLVPGHYPRQISARRAPIPCRGPARRGTVAAATAIQPHIHTAP